MANPHAANTQDVYDAIVVGGGVAGIQLADEYLQLSTAEGRPMKILVLADQINASSQANTNLVLGLDGFEEDDQDPRRFELNKLIKKGVERVYERADQLGVKKASRGYQLIETTQEAVEGVAQWLVDTFNYAKQEFTSVKDAQRVQFTGLAHAIATPEIGLMNVPELEQRMITNMQLKGVTVQEGVRVESVIHQNGAYRVVTNRGTFTTHTPPDLAMGLGLNEFKGVPKQEALYTMAGHIQLTDEQYKRFNPGGTPMGFCADVADGAKMVWGGVDNNRLLTIGFGETEDLSNVDKLRKNLAAKVRELLPWMDDKQIESMAIDFKPMAMTENRHPIVGRFGDFNVSAGYCSRGLGQSRAAAMALAKWKVLGDDSDLKLFEDLNPAPVTQPQPAQPQQARAYGPAIQLRA